MSVVCKNCGKHFSGKYCPECAQKATAGRLKVSNVAEEFLHNFTHADRTVFGLISSLFKNPGKVIREYIAARRKAYFSPYTYFLISSAILIFLTSLVFQYEDKLYHFNNEFGQYTSKHYTIIVLCSIPFISSLLLLFLNSEKLNYAEWTVFVIFGYCVINTVQIFFQLLYFVFIKYHRAMLGITELSTYIILLIILISFVKPRNFLKWLQCIISIVSVFFLVEAVAKLIALMIYGVPLKLLLKNYSIF